MTPRPGYHFSPPAGHLNDPLGVTWHDHRYELFFQLNPHGPAWAPDCRWGQAHGRDLVRWEQPRIALEPAPGEGCWSGAVAVDRDGVPVILYTSVDVAAPDLGRVTLATGSAGWDRWTAGEHVVDPPPELGLHTFRDPFVLAVPGGWRMLVGAGARDGRALALQYSSPDLRRWRLDGAVAERPATESDPLPTGTAWECPQLFPLDGAWVLLVSAWDGAPRRVVAAVGEYDGLRFTARAWQPLDATGELYATTAFRDGAGRWCALSWLPGGGMFSLPYLLALDGDRLCVAPHPDVDRLVGAPLQVPGSPLSPLLDVSVPEGVGLAVRAEDGGELLRVEWGGAGPRLLRPDRPDAALPAGDLRLLLDVGVAEAFAGGAVAALRLAGDGGPLLLDAPGSGLVVRPVERWFSR